MQLSGNEKIRDLLSQTAVDSHQSKHITLHFDTLSHICVREGSVIDWGPVQDKRLHKMKE